MIVPPIGFQPRIEPLDGLVIDFRKSEISYQMLPVLGHSHEAAIFSGNQFVQFLEEFVDF